MQQVLAVYAGDDILRSARDAGSLRRRVEDVLSEGDDMVAVLDFAGVNGLSPTFIDELLAPLFDQLGEQMPDRVLLDNCSASVLNDLKCVAETARPVTISPRVVAERAGRQAA